MFVSFWLFPIISAVVWIGMLLAMLIYWLANSSPHYSSMESNQSIAYISDVGATELKPLFIAGSCVTTIFLDASFAADRWLRHKGTLVRNTTVVEKVLSGLAILAALVGTVGLICLSVFDTAHYPRMHDAFLAVFIVGYVVSAIFLCAEFQRLGAKNRQHRVLRISFWVKLAFILLEVALAIVFGVTNRSARNAAAVTEWVIALVFTFWVLSFLIDLLPAVAKGRGGRGAKDRSGPAGGQGSGELGGAGLEFGEGRGLRADDGQMSEGYAEGGYRGPSRSAAPGQLAPSRNF